MTKFARKILNAYLETKAALMISEAKALRQIQAEQTALRESFAKSYGRLSRRDAEEIRAFLGDEARELLPPEREARAS